MCVYVFTVSVSAKEYTILRDSLLDPVLHPALQLKLLTLGAEGALDGTLVHAIISTAMRGLV